MQLFFVCDHSPKQFVDWLGDEAQDIKKLSKRPKGILLFTGYMPNRNTIESLAKSTAKLVVFDGPLTAKSYGVNFLDIRATTSPPYYGIEFIKLNKAVWNKAVDYEYTCSKYDLQATIIGSLESKSLLNALMTAIYTLPSASQKLVKVALINWLFFDGRVKNIGTLLQILSQRTKISKNSTDQLIEIMSSELAHIYHEAIHQKGDVGVIAAEYDISDYDIRYMQKIKGTKQEYLSSIRSTL